MKIQAPSTRTSFILVFLLGLCNVLQAQILDEKQMKLNIKKIVNPLEQLQSLNPITYNYNIKDFKELDLPEGNHAGFLLTEVETTLPDIIKIENKVYQEGKNNTKVYKVPSVKQEDLTSILVAAIKEQQLQIDELKKELKELKAQ